MPTYAWPLNDQSGSKGAGLPCGPSGQSISTVASIVAKTMRRLLSARCLPIHMLYTALASPTTVQVGLCAPPSKPETPGWEWLAVAALGFWQIPPWLETERVGIDGFVVHHSPDILIDYCALGNKHAVIDIVGNAGMWDAKWRQRVHPVRLLQDEVQIWQVRYIVPGRKPIITHDAINLGLCAALHVGVLH